MKQVPQYYGKEYTEECFEYYKYNLKDNQLMEKVKCPTPRRRWLPPNDKRKIRRYPELELVPAYKNESTR